MVISPSCETERPSGRSPENELKGTKSTKRLHGGYGLVTTYEIPKVVTKVLLVKSLQPKCLSELIRLDGASI